ncbi:MAG: hypothetical protein HY720_12645 [Planctomycetes bacterium]|nr:hypothetical protein [Planctomycetota bacterium]
MRYLWLAVLLVAGIGQAVGQDAFTARLRRDKVALLRGTSLEVFVTTHAIRGAPETDRAAVQTEVELLFRGHGVKVYREEERVEGRMTGVLWVHVGSGIRDDTTHFGDVVVVVEFVRNVWDQDGVERTLVTWRSQTELFFALPGTSDMPVGALTINDIPAEAAGACREFLNDYLEANQ